jgi:homoprotocatechuate degradation regulator HpaR
MRKTTGLQPFKSTLPMALLRARESVMQQFRPDLRRLDVTEQQWRVLRVLADNGEMELTELAGHACLLLPSLSRILRDLEQRRLIARAAHASDQRRSLVSIAPKGLDIIRSHAPRSKKAYAHITERFGAERLALLQRLLTELVESIEE